jgi:hypothetical protein
LRKVHTSERLRETTSPLESTLTRPHRAARNSFKTCDFKPFRINTYVFFHRNPFGFNTYTKTGVGGGGDSYLAFERGRPMHRLHMTRLPTNGSESIVLIGSARPKGELEFNRRRLRPRKSPGFQYLGNHWYSFDILKQGNPLIAHGCTLHRHGARALRARALLGASPIRVRALLAARAIRVRAPLGASPVDVWRSDV